METPNAEGLHDSTLEVNVVGEPNEPDSLMVKGEMLRHEINFRVVRSLQKATEEKVGLVSSRSRLGRGLQAVGSYLTPGDLSKLRNPVRSAVFGAVTPGGGGGLGAPIGGVPDILRCPVGFENGGQYATRGFANCGRQLFEPPTSIDDLGNNSSPTGNLAFGLIGLLDSEGRRVTGSRNLSGRTVQIQRAAQIPRVAGARPKDRDTAVARLVSSIGETTENRRLMVRQDGFVLKPSVDGSVLRRNSKNPDMANATFVVNAPDPSRMGEEDLPLLWSTGARSLVVALPGGSNSIELTRTRDLTAGDKRRLTRAWASTPEQAEFDFGSRLRSLADSSNGSISYTERLGGDQPNQLVRIGDTNGGQRSVRKWVFDTYLSDNAPSRKGRKPWKQIGETEELNGADDRISDLKRAVESLKGGEPLDKIPSRFVDDALKRSLAFKRTSVRSGVERLDRPNGNQFFRLESDRENGALAARVGADLRNTLGLPPSTVKIVGTPDKRAVVASSAQNIRGGRVNRNKELSAISVEQTMRLAISDWLLDDKDRSPGTISPFESGNKVQAYVSTSFGGAAAGLSREELEARRRLVLGDFYTPENTFQRMIEKRPSRQQRAALPVLSQILKQLEDFNWDDYKTRLGLDGDLSDNEKAHLNIIQSVFEDRLKKLKASKKQFLQIIGFRRELLGGL